MSEITLQLRSALDSADAVLKEGDTHSTARRLEEARRILIAVVEAVEALDSRLDRLDGTTR